MRLPKYEKSKNSGVAWLGTVPAHWEVVQSRRYFKDRNEKASPEDRQLTASQKHGVIFQADFMEREGQKVVQVVVGAEILKRVEPNDFVISMRSFQGGIEWCGFRGSISSAYVMLTPSEAVWPPFFRYLFKSTIYIQALQSTTNLVRDGQALRFSNFAQVPLPLAPIAEQRIIAAFLDRETAKIDALIAEQEKLIALLAEKRRATIFQAVTRGLDPECPIKETDLEWLGPIPVHWEIGPIKHFFRSLDGRRIPVSSEERGLRPGEFPYYGASGVIDYIDSYIFEEDLLLVSEDGANLLNRTTPIAFIATGKYWVNNHAHILKPLDRNLRFWTERIEAIDLAPFVTGSAQPKLTIEALMNLIISAPASSEEREAISRYIDVETAKLNQLGVETKRAIALLTERRSALIAAAVTGQIDVRGAVLD